VVIVRATIIAAAPGLILVPTGDVFVKALARRLSLARFIGSWLDRQIALTLLQLALLQLSVLGLLLLLLLLLATLLLLTVLLLLLLLALLLALLLLALLAGALQCLLLSASLLVLLLQLLALLYILLLLLLALLSLLLLHLLALLVLLLLLLLPRVGVATVGIAWTVIIGQTLRADAQRQQADTCQKPDTRIHAFLTAARIPDDRTAFSVRRSRHSISESVRIEL
jgi:hypothetical protein